MAAPKPTPARAAGSAHLPQEAVAFLNALYWRAPAGSHIELRPFAPAWADKNLHKVANQWRTWKPVGESEDMARLAWRAATSGTGIDVYMGVAARRPRGGTARDVVAVTALWTELDGEPSKKGNGCQTKDEAYARLQALQLVTPSIIVDSGGGFHAYLLLDEPITGEDLRHVPLWNARFRELLRNESGYAGDDVGDLPRILRLPGTSNHKLQNEMRPVRLVHCDPESVYSLAWLDQNLPALPEASFRTSSDAMPTAELSPMSWSDELWAKRADLVAAGGAAWAQAEGHRHFLPHPMARVLLVSGWPWQDIPALVGEIAKAGGSQSLDDRMRDARKELGDKSDRARVGWPWLRSHVPEMAAAMAKLLNPQTEDLNEMAERVREVRGASTATTAIPAPVAPIDNVKQLKAVEAVDKNVNDQVTYAPIGIPGLDRLMELTRLANAAVAPPAGASTATTAIPAPVAPIDNVKQLKAVKGADAGVPDGRAAERVYNLLRDKLAWVGTGRDDNRPYAGRRRFDGHRNVIETIPLDGKEAKYWALEVVKSAGMSLTESHRNVAIDLLQADARHADVPLSLRYAMADDGDWLVDIGDKDWSRVRISPGAWMIESSESPTFLRTACTLPYPQPERLAAPQDLIDGLMAVLNCDEDLVAQLACWLPQALHPTAPRMGLFVTGPQGSGKSTFAGLARRIVDPARPNLIKFAAKRNEVDYATANVHKNMMACIGYSNVSSLSEAASDLFCGFITGDGHIQRALYSDVDPVLSSGRRSLIIEGISVLGMGADLQDRLLHLALPLRTDFEPETAFERRTLDWMPRLVGGLFAVTADALGRLDSIEERYAEVLNRCRMRDAAAMYGAAAEALGYDAGDMLQRLVRARAEAQGAEAESDVVGQRMLAFVEKMRAFSSEVIFTGTIESLDGRLIEDSKPPEMWPKSLRAFRAKLERLVPGLRARGLVLTFFRSKDLERKSSVSIKRVDVQQNLGTEDDAPILPARFGVAVQTITEFTDATGCFSEQLLDLLAQNKIAGYDVWTERMAAVSALTGKERSRVLQAAARRYQTVSLPAPDLAEQAIHWMEMTPGHAERWHTWLVGALHNA
jgi:energy-coupling factor transporter ATP-binding protein EcfA2